MNLTKKWTVTFLDPKEQITLPSYMIGNPKPIYLKSRIGASSWDFGSTSQLLKAEFTKEKLEIRAGKNVIEGTANHPCEKAER